MAALAIDLLVVHLEGLVVLAVLGRSQAEAPLLGVGLRLAQLLEHGVGDGQHHGGGGRVADPHGQEGRGRHEADHQPEWEGGQHPSLSLAQEVVRVWVIIIITVLYSGESATRRQRR